MNIKQITRILYIFSGLIFIAGIGLLVWFGFFESKSMNRIDTSEDIIDIEHNNTCKLKRIIDGICVEHEKDKNPELIAVMVENHVDARPQSGLSKARIVYEAPVEANYSRFMLIYTRDEIVEKIGPVRSARPYYLDLLAEYDSVMYMHVGGSPDALDIISERGLFDLNEFYRGWYYWRSEDRYAPHNVYTSSKLWNKAWDDYGNNYTDEDGWREKQSYWTFDTQDICEDDCVDNIFVTFLSPSYVAEWKFNSSTKKYVRYQMGKEHTDQDGNMIEADTVIVQYVETDVLDDKGRLAMDLIGQGDIMIFRDGYMVQGRWSKDSVDTKTQWLDSEGNKISLKSGKIWIEVVNQRGYVEF